MQTTKQLAKKSNVTKYCSAQCAIYLNHRSSKWYVLMFGQCLFKHFRLP